jgi:hypothetical protein
MSNLRQREITQIAAESVSSPAIEHGVLAEMSQMAAVAANRLQPGRTPSAEDMKVVLGILRGIENLGLVGFLRRHGTEDEYQAIGVTVGRRFAPPTRRV